MIWLIVFTLSSLFLWKGHDKNYLSDWQKNLGRLMRDYDDVKRTGDRASVVTAATIEMFIAFHSVSAFCITMIRKKAEEEFLGIFEQLYDCTLLRMRQYGTATC